MSTKKRFTIASDLASGIRNTMQSASSNQGQLHYDMMALDVIEPDPDNPRKLSITRHEILNGLNPLDPNYKTKLKNLESLQELAESIKRVGVRNAIEVYKDSSKYFIITGERRYWAALLANQKTIPVRINPKPDDFNLRYIQWVENINRKDLSLWERFHNLNLLNEAQKNSNQGELTEISIQKLLSISSIQAYRYFCLLKADEKILELIQLEKLNNLKLVQELVSIKDKIAKKQIITWIASSKKEITSLADYREVAGKKSPNSKAKNQKTIRLGKINNTHVAKQLLEIVISDHRLQKHRAKFANVDWTSIKAINKVFKNLFKVLEDEFNPQEMVS
ncbi:MAG TPA: ParB/RepB/Spo0J family partition protein [Gammaproteobacteria bacterium]|jgi:ParB/RepB/Spo0J family partition protein|nr:ParB/RepB/Spo0J family partition protein [Gammaproteobacteria bacterium]